MAHKEWCGKPCGECDNPCELDESMPCFLGCKDLDYESGLPISKKCKTCDSYLMNKRELDPEIQEYKRSLKEKSQ